MELKTRTNQPVVGDEFTGDIAFTGDVKCFENIVDKDGHKRFIGGDITTETTEGFTFNYGKWSLCGTHLIIVLAGSVANNTTFTAKVVGVLQNVPQWIRNKIYPLFSSIVARDEVVLFNEDYSTQTAYCYLTKTTNDLQLYLGSITATKDRIFRIEFDLLIDNE